MDDKKLKVVFKKQKGLSWFVQVIIFLLGIFLVVFLKSSGFFDETFGCMLGQQGYWKDQSSYYFCGRTDYWKKYLKPMYEEMGIDTDSNATITEEQLEHLKPVQNYVMPNLEGDPCAKDPTMYGYLAPGKDFVRCP